MEDDNNNYCFDTINYDNIENDNFIINEPSAEIHFEICSLKSIISEQTSKLLWRFVAALMLVFHLDNTKKLISI